MFELTDRRVCSAVIAAEFVSKLEAIFDVPLKVELSFCLGTYRTFTGTAERHHAFGPLEQRLRAQPVVATDYRANLVRGWRHAAKTGAGSRAAPWRAAGKRERPRQGSVAFPPEIVVGLAEERQEALAVAVGDRERLNAKLLLNLEGLQAGRFRVHVGVDELADTAGHRVNQGLHEFRIVRDAVLDGSEVG